jgi:hypothetical protein
MADEFYRKQLIFQRHGKGLRPYPFSFVELVNPSTGIVIGSGLMPDNESILQDVPRYSDTDGAPQIQQDMCIDPPWIYGNTYATGVVNRFG